MAASHPVITLVRSVRAQKAAIPRGLACVTEPKTGARLIVAPRRGAALCLHIKTAGSDDPLCLSRACNDSFSKASFV